MLAAAATYDATVAGFRWAIPETYNIATGTCDRWAAGEPDRIALTIVDGDDKARPWTFGELRASANRIANVLKARGVEPGDRVAILLPQSADVAIGHLAIYKLAAVAVPLAALFGVEALAYRLKDSGAKVLITDRAGAERVASIRDDLPDLKAVFSVVGSAEGAEDMWALAEAASDRFATATTGPDTPALMIYTSGTTGPPKGALHGHRVLLGHLPGVQISHEFLPRPDDRLWTPADWAWAGGLLNILLPALHFGVPVIGQATEKFDPERAFRLMADHGVRNTFIPPTALKMLRTVTNPRSRFDLRLRTIGSGGESLGRETYEWGREALGLSINEFYGQTECNLVLSSCAAIGVSKPGAIGRTVPGHQVAIVDDSGAPVAPGTPGQIAVKAPDPVMFLEYWNNPSATKSKFIGDWLTTGDQGVMDEDGFVSFFGRDDDVITSAGYRIGPGEIEDCLIGHPAVALAAVVGKPDPLRTEIVKAFIVPAAGVTPDDALSEDIQSYVRTRLAAHEYPREIEYRDSLPLTTTGKIIRRALREGGGV